MTSILIIYYFPNSNTRQNAIQLASIVCTMFYLFDHCSHLSSFFHALLHFYLFLVVPKAPVSAGTVIDKLPPSSWRGEHDCL